MAADVIFAAFTHSEGVYRVSPLIIAVIVAVVVIVAIVVFVLKNYRKVGPNEACPCGSGKKIKKCCGSI